MDTTVQKCSGEVKQTPNYPLQIKLILTYLKWRRVYSNAPPLV